jgi:hypothetical protein
VLAHGAYVGERVKHFVDAPPLAAAASCEAVLGLQLGASRYADVKLGFLRSTRLTFRSR